MGTYGGFAPQPERCGGGRRNVEYILDALLQSSSQEVGLDTTPGNDVWVEDLSTARLLSASWDTNERGANEFDPRRTQSMLPRWEALFGVIPPLGATPASRRAAVVFAFEALGKSPSSGQVTDDLTYLGTSPDGVLCVFLQVVNTSSATGPSYYPGSGFSNPYDPSGTTTAGVSIVDWWSAVLNVAVQVQQPAGMSPALFNDLVGNLVRYLDGTLPAWCTFSVFQLAHGSPAVGGFYLDEANLGIEALAS